MNLTRKNSGRKYKLSINYMKNARQIPERELPSFPIVIKSSFILFITFVYVSDVIK